MKNKHIFIIGALILLGLFFSINSTLKQKNVVYVYSWVDVIPQEVIKEFEKKTGIKVIMDFYDSNESLEAKLMMGTSGYDVVFPSAVPFAARQIKFGAYEKIDKTKIPNLNNICEIFYKDTKNFDKNKDYFIPQLWGTVGFMYDEEKVKLYNYNKSNQLLKAMDFLDHNKLKLWARSGISMLPEAGEFIPFIMLYLGYDINSENQQEIENAIKYGIKIRKYIKSFQDFKSVNDMYNKDIIIAQVWSGQYFKLLKKLQEDGITNRKIKYAVPEKVKPYWLDGIAIPKGAPNINNAYKFINYILDTKVAAKISQNVLEASTIPETENFFDDFTKKNLSYSKKMLQSLKMIQVQTKEKNRQLVDGMRRIIIGGLFQNE